MIGVETGTISNAVTNSDGIYTVPNLPIGAYRRNRRIQETGSCEPWAS
jgi:hypothetical protein